MPRLASPHGERTLQRHAGHADILREHLDGSVGVLPQQPNLPDGTDLPAHTQRLAAIAERFSGIGPRPHD